MKTLQAGYYLIGDCCYVLRTPHYDWDDFCKQFFDDGESIKIDDHEIVAYSTAYGDGEYFDQEGRSYPVDAALIGIVPASMWKGEGVPDDCHLIYFENDFVCEDLGDGKLSFGRIVIDTDPEWEYWHDDCEYCGTEHVEFEDDEDD